MGWFIYCMKQYATFEGRASRSEYWWFWAIVWAGILASRLLKFFTPFYGGALEIVWGLAVIVPHMAVASRRLHDTDRTGWWMALMFSAPLAGSAVKHKLLSETDSVSLLLAVLGTAVVATFVVVVFLCQRGDDRANRFGESAPSTPE